MRAPVVVRDETFKKDLAKLLTKYPELDKAIQENEYLLGLNYPLPHMPADTSSPKVYAVRIDYPPMGSRGIGRFLMTYHATDLTPHMQIPLQTFTLLTIAERDED